MNKWFRKIADVWLMLCVVVFASGCAPLGFLGGLGGLLGLAVGGGIATFSSGDGDNSIIGGGSVPVEQLAFNQQFNPGVGGNNGGFPPIGGDEIATIVNPEPASMMLLGTGIAAMAFIRSRSARKQI